MAFECMLKGKPVTRKEHKAVLPPAEDNKPSMFGLFAGNSSSTPPKAVQDPDPHPPAGEFAELERGESERTRKEDHADATMPFTPRSAANMMLVLLERFACVCQELKTQTNPADADVEDDESSSPQNPTSLCITSKPQVMSFENVTESSSQKSELSGITRNLFQCSSN